MVCVGKEQMRKTRPESESTKLIKLHFVLGNKGCMSLIVIFLNDCRGAFTTFLRCSHSGQPLEVDCLQKKSPLKCIHMETYCFYYFLVWQLSYTYSNVIHTDSN